MADEKSGQEPSPKFEGPQGFALARSDVVAIAIGVIVALIGFLEPNKTPPVVVVCLLAIALCLGYLLFHWCCHWSWIKNASPRDKKIRFGLIGLLGFVCVAVYGWHVWPTEDQTAKNIQRILLGQEYDSEKLAAQFPIGYVVFQLKNNDKLEFYKGLSMVQNYDFDWSKVKYLKNENDKFEVLMPDIVEVSSSQRMMFREFHFSGQKRVGYWNTYYTSRQFRAVAEVLHTSPEGIVFLIGLMAPKD